MLSPFSTLSTVLENIVGIYLIEILFDALAFFCSLTIESIVRILLSFIYSISTLYTSFISEIGR